MAIEQDDEPPLSQEEVEQIMQNGELLRLVWRGMPRRVFRQSWERFGLGCMSRAYSTLGSIFQLNHDGPDCATLARSLYEHVVAFAWLAEDPEVRLKMLLRKSAVEMSKTAAELRLLGTVTIDPEIIETLQREKEGEKAPGVADQALAADACWTRRIPSWSWGFRRSYSNMYRPYSFFVHPSGPGLDVFFDSHGALDVTNCDSRVGHVRAGAAAAFADGLVVASEVLGWPRREDVFNAYTDKMV